MLQNQSNYVQALYYDNNLYKEFSFVHQEDSMANLPYLTNSELERISNILGDTSSGFTGSEISRLLSLCNIPDAWPNGTKRLRLFNSFANYSNQNKNSNCVYAFIKEALAPARWLDSPTGRAAMALQINEVLALKGVQINNRNEFITVRTAETVSDAKQRASQLSQKLYNLHIHSFVLKCCREELLQDNYFHAVFEAAKSLTDRIASETGLNLDGTKLIEKAFSIEHPAIVMNKLQTDSEKNQHRGLKELLLGINYSVRNVTAHELKIKWAIEEDKAINMLSIISSLHKELDECHFIRQV